MDQRVIEQTVISSIKSFDDLMSLRSKLVTEGSFVIYPDVFRFIVSFSRDYKGQIPSMDVIQQNFTYFSPQTSENIDYFIDKLTESELSRKATKVISAGIEILEEQKKPREAVSYITSELSRLKAQDQVTRSRTDKDALKRLDKYIEKEGRVSRGLTVGLRTGISFFEEQFLGWVPGNLIGIIGSTKIGKSWLALYLGCVVHFDGKRVLFISPELSIDEAEARWDTIDAQMKGFEFSNIGLMRGRAIDVEKYRQFLEECSEREDWFTFVSSEEQGPFTLESITDLTTTYKPDLVIVDGVPLIEDKEEKQGWEKIKRISYGLKSLATSKGIVIVATNQATRGAADKETPRLGDVGYGYSFVQACDKVLLLSKASEGDKKKRLLRLTGVRVGESAEEATEISFDVDIGVIG